MLAIKARRSRPSRGIPHLTPPLTAWALGLTAAVSAAPLSSGIDEERAPFLALSNDTRGKQLDTARLEAPAWIKVGLDDGSVILGRIQTRTLLFDSSLGQIEVAVSEIVDLRQDVLTLADGSVFRGALSDRKLSIETTRGIVEVGGSRLDSLQPPERQSGSLPGRSEGGLPCASADRMAAAISHAHTPILSASAPGTPAPDVVELLKAAATEAGLLFVGESPVHKQIMAVTGDHADFFAILSFSDPDLLALLKEEPSVRAILFPLIHFRVALTEDAQAGARLHYLDPVLFIDELNQMSPGMQERLLLTRSKIEALIRNVAD